MLLIDKTLNNHPALLKSSHQYINNYKLFLIINISVTISLTVKSLDGTALLT